MSLNYDKTANNKPANGTMLHLNNEGFKQEQNNINNNESTLKLDISVLSSQEEINGTECVGLLLEQWRTVASICDIFRNFGTGVLDPTLGKMMMSINKIDDDAAKSTELEKMLDLNKPGNNAKGAFLSPSTNAIYATNAFSAGEAMFMTTQLNNVNAKDEEYHFISAFQEIYDDIGECGGDHKHMGEGFNWDLILVNLGVTGEDDGLFEYVKNNSIYDTNPKVHEYLQETTSFDVAAGNILIDQSLKYSDEDFKNHVGFSRIRNGDFDFRTITTDYRLKSYGQIDVNKAVGVEAYIQEKCFYYRDHKDEFNEAYPYIELMDKNGNFTNEVREIFRNEAREFAYNDRFPIMYSDYNSSAIMLNKLSRYCDEVNYDMDFKRLGKDSANPSPVDISVELNSGRSCVFQAENVKLKKIGDDSEKVISDPEELTVINVPAIDTLEVSYMGESWVLYLDEQNNDAKINDFYSILITDREPNGTDENNITEEDLFIEVKDRIGYEIYNDLQPDSYLTLDKIDEALKKVGPAYEARLNAIFDEYYGREEEFEQKYGIKYYSNDGKRNMRILLYKLYMETGDAVTIDFRDPEQRKKYADFRRLYYLLNPDKFEEKYKHKLFAGEGIVAVDINKICEDEALHQKFEYDNIGEHIVTVHACGLYWGKVTREDLNKRFAAFANNHGDSVSVVPLIGVSKKDRMEALFANNRKPTFQEVKESLLYDGIPTNSEIKYMLDSGYEVVFKLTKTQYLEDINGTQGLTGARELNADEVTVRDIAPDGRYIVEVDGKEYFFDAVKYNNYCSEYYAIKAKAI